MSTSGELRKNQFLTNLSVAYPEGNLIGEQLCPIVDAETMADFIFVDADDAIDQSYDEAEDVQSNEVDFSTGTPYPYRTTRKALNTTISKKKLDNAKKPVNLKARETKKLTARLRKLHEMRVQTVLRNSSLIQTLDVDGIADGRLDESSPDFKGYILEAVKYINNQVGMPANVIAIPFEAALHVANIDWVEELLKPQYGMQVLTGKFQQQVMQLVGLPPYIKGLKVIISNGRVNTGKKGKSKAVENPWGKDIVIGYVPQTPGIDDMFGLLTMQYEARQVWEKTIDDPRGVKIVTEWDYDITKANLGCFYLLKDVIA